MVERVPNVSKGSTASVKPSSRKCPVSGPLRKAWWAALVIWTIAALLSLGCLALLTLPRTASALARFSTGAR